MKSNKPGAAYLVLVIAVLIFLLTMVSFEDNIFGLVFFATPAFMLMIYCAIGIINPDITQEQRSTTPAPPPAQLYTERILKQPSTQYTGTRSYTGNTTRLNDNAEERITAAVIQALYNQSDILRAEITQDVLRTMGYDKTYRD